LAAILSVSGLWAAVGAAGSPGPSGHVASTMSVREHVTLKLVKRTGSTKFEHSGRATGTVGGAVRSKITLTHSVVLRGIVTIATSRGKLRLKVDGRARGIEQRSPFDGTATILTGTGRYAKAKGKGTFKGVVNRATWAATIDAKGTFTY
jgi:hypothetical protein